MFLPRSYRHGLAAIAGLLVVITLSGCGFLFGPAGPEPTPTLLPNESRALIPTFTPTSAEPPHDPQPPE